MGGGGVRCVCLGAQVPGSAARFVNRQRGLHLPALWLTLREAPCVYSHAYYYCCVWEAIRISLSRGSEDTLMIARKNPSAVNLEIH